MTLIIGLTGGIGSGKTTVAKLFSALGAGVVDTDMIAHELTQLGGGAISAIREAFGERFISAGGSLNRREMRDVVFFDEESRRKLEMILHPLIRTEAARRAARVSAPYAMMVVPLLLETRGYCEVIQRVLVTDCSEHQQIARAAARPGMDERTVRAIMAAQVSREQRLLQADDVIVNNAGMAQLEQRVNALHKQYLALASRS
ncbi:MAG: dephospho-CoA kinase [Nitrosospira sp.]|nr:dephospho-CoA kinase [Nitrosospira sp.]